MPTELAVFLNLLTIACAVYILSSAEQLALLILGLILLPVGAFLLLVNLGVL